VFETTISTAKRSEFKTISSSAKKSSPGIIG
jgi:hypothetical protein